MSDFLSGIPRSEYPRPDFQRGTSQGIDWVNLNGTWEFVFDPDVVKKGSMISLSASLLLFIIIIGMSYKFFIKN